MGGSPRMICTWDIDAVDTMIRILSACQNANCEKELCYHHRSVPRALKCHWQHCDLNKKWPCEERGLSHQSVIACSRGQRIDKPDLLPLTTCWRIPCPAPHHIPVICHPTDTIVSPLHGGMKYDCRMSRTEEQQMMTIRQLLNTYFIRCILNCL